MSNSKEKSKNFIDDSGISDAAIQKKVNKLNEEKKKKEQKKEKEASKKKS